MARRHIVIGGTGRAGTSFLVEFLAACGLETAGEASEWHARARAGGESRLDSGTELPYVVKDPWLWTYCKSLDLSRLSIEALVVPVRDLTSAAASRVLQERAAIAGTPAVDRGDLNVFGYTPGGVVYSLTVVDQARILAVGFHELLQWAVSNDIRTLLLDFPRIVEDGEYLVSSLWPLLEGQLERPAAIEAFARVARSDAVRLHSQRGRPAVFRSAEADADAALDRAGLAMRIGELRAEVEGARERLAAVEIELTEARARQTASDEQVALLQAELAVTRARNTRQTRVPRALRAIRQRF